MVAGEGTKHEKRFAAETKFPGGVSRLRGNVGGPWRAVGIVKFLQQIPAAADIPVVGTQFLFGANEHRQCVAFFGILAGHADQFAEGCGINSSCEVIYKGIPQCALLLTGHSKVAGVVGIQHMPAKFGVDDGQPGGNVGCKWCD